jgi:hypothetical protein
VDYREWGYGVRGPRESRDPRERVPSADGWTRPDGYDDMTEYRDGYEPEGYGPRGYRARADDGDGRGGTVYGAGRHSRDDVPVSGPAERGYPGPDPDGDVPPTGDARGRARPVWRPTRGVRAGEGGRPDDPGYGAPTRGWRTADGGYRTPDGHWSAPYQPYDTGEWRRDQRSDTGPAGTGEIAPYSSGSGEIERYSPRSTGETPRYRPGGTGEIARYRDRTGETRPPDRTGEIGRRRSDRTGDIPRPPDGSGEIARYRGSHTGEVPRVTGGSGEIARYRGGRTGDIPRPPDGSGEIARYRGSGEVPRYRADTDGTGRRRAGAGRPPGADPASGPVGPASGPAGMAGGPAGLGRAGAGPARGYPTPAEPGETTRIPRQRPTSGPAYDEPAGYGPAEPRRWPPDGGRRSNGTRGGATEEPAEVYEYDPLTFGGGTSPAMRYDKATDSYSYGPPPASAAPDQRRPYRAPTPPPDQRRPYSAPAAQPPVRRPVQRFEGTYPTRPVSRPRNIPPPGRRVPIEPDDDEATESPGFMHTALVTTAWYTIPLLLYTMYVLTLDGSAQAGDGQSARDNALDGLLGGMPRVGVALATSLVVALLIRAIARGWRAATIGFASAVVGAGGAAIIFAALQG